MYELKQGLCAFFLNSTEKIYAKSSIQVRIYSTENIPSPTSRDIIITDKGAEGKDIIIILNVGGDVSQTTKNEYLEVPVEIIDAGQELDEQGVRDEIGSKVYNVTVRVVKDNVEKSADGGKITNKSTIEIE